MTPDKLKEILQKGESIEVEFKTSQFELNKNAFESICAFLNRKGGYLLLGVKNDGTVEGVIDDCVQYVICLQPTYYLLLTTYFSLALYHRTKQEFW